MPLRNIGVVLGFESTFCFVIEVFVRVGASEREQHVVDETDRRRRALDVEEDAFGHLPDIYCEVRHAEADRLKLRFYSAVGVYGRPSRGILKQTNRADLPVCAQIEPVPRAARDANQSPASTSIATTGSAVTG